MGSSKENEGGTAGFEAGASSSSSSSSPARVKANAGVELVGASSSSGAEKNILGTTTSSSCTCMAAIFSCKSTSGVGGKGSGRLAPSRPTGAGAGAGKGVGRGGLLLEEGGGREGSVAARLSGKVGDEGEGEVGACASEAERESVELLGRDVVEMGVGRGRLPPAAPGATGSGRPEDPAAGLGVGRGRPVVGGAVAAECGVGRVEGVGGMVYEMVVGGVGTCCCCPCATALVPPDPAIGSTTSIPNPLAHRTASSLALHCISSPPCTGATRPCWA